MESRIASAKKSWQEEYSQKYRRFFRRPDLAQDFYAKQENAWLFVSSHIERFLGYALKMYFLYPDTKESIHTDCMSEVLLAMYATKCASSDEFQRETLRQCSNSAARAIYAYKKNQSINQRTISLDDLEVQVAEPEWDFSQYSKFFDAAQQLQAKQYLQNRRASRLLTEVDIEKLGAEELKLLVLYLLVVILHLSKTSKLETRALIGAYLLGDNDEVTSKKVLKRTRFAVEPGNIRKARAKGIKKLRVFLQSVERQ